MKKKIVVTGGSGIIGSELIRQLLNNDQCRVLNIDCLTYAGNKELSWQADMVLGCIQSLEVFLNNYCPSIQLSMH